MRHPRAAGLSNYLAIGSAVRDTLRLWGAEGAEQRLPNERAATWVQIAGRYDQAWRRLLRNVLEQKLKCWSILDQRKPCVHYRDGGRELRIGLDFVCTYDAFSSLGWSHLYRYLGISTWTSMKFPS